MGVFHYLNVNEGDCSIIQHPSGHVSVIDVNNAESPSFDALLEVLGANRDFGQKDESLNPVEYLQRLGISSIFRFILTHPDMDHMGGIKSLFETFSPVNFWDTMNNEDKEFDETSSHRESDWLFYKGLRDNNPDTEPKRLTLYADASGQYYNISQDRSHGGDGLYILAPTEKLIQLANQNGNYNDASYVILYISEGGRILITGDSHHKTWEHILSNHTSDVRNVDILIAPHHGRKSDGSFDFLDTVKPTITFFGNAPPEHLAYDAWSNRKLPIITNNQANCMIVNTNVRPMKLYVTNEAFARRRNPNTYWDEQLKSFYIRDV